MANTARAGISDGGAFVDIAADYIGATGLYQTPFRQWTAGGGGNPGVEDPFRLLTAGGVRTDVVKAGAKTPTARAAISEARATTLSLDWHERIHILPRLPIDFGNIITLEQEDFELFNAYRDLSVTLNAITDDVSPGIEFTNLVPPVTRGKQSSFLDPSSTTQSTTALGTMVKQKVSATELGLPTFDGSAIFAFSSGDEVSLDLSGIRIVFIPMEYESPVNETLAFLTDVIESLDGNEQRLALRSAPRQSFQVTYLLDGNDRQRMHMLLMDWLDRVFGFPLWHEAVRLTATATAGGTVYQVSGADVVDFRVGGLAVVLTDANTFDVVNIAGVTATTITASDPRVNAYPAGTLIMPLRIARITRAVQGRRYPVNLEEFQVEFEVTDNTTGAPTGSTTGWSSYNSRVLLDDCNVVEGSMSQTFGRRLYVIDNQTGVVNVRSPWDRFKRNQTKGFVSRNRAEILKLRRLLLALNGKQKAFYLPTFTEDVTPKATLNSGAATLDIENIEYTRYAQARDPKNIVRVTFTDGTSLVRVVQSSVKVDATTERLTLDATWPTTRPVSEVSRVQFYELVRFDADNFTLSYPRAGLAELQAPVRAVFDDA